MTARSPRPRVRFDRRLFRSRVARRMFVVFVLCALAPVSGFALYAFSRVSAQLESDARAQLRAESKITGMAILERLALADSIVLGEPPGGRAAAAAPTSPVRRSFLAPGPNVPDALRSELPALLPATPRERSHLRAGGALLRSLRGAAGESRLFLVRELPGGSRYHVGELAPAALWRPDTVRGGGHLAVLEEDGHPLFATFDTAELGSAVEARRVTLGGERYMAESWEIFLGAGYRAPPWTLVEMRREADVFAPVREFRAVFPLVALLAVWVAALLGSSQIRRHLVPIDRLHAATESIASRRFDVRVEIDSDDEFRELGDAFNEMASRIGDLTANLEAKVAQRTSELSDALGELRATQAQLVHREKMASLGQFVAGIAHELNNPLSFIGGNLHFLRMYAADLTAALESVRTASRDGSAPLDAVVESIWRDRKLDEVLAGLDEVFDGCAEGVQRTTGLVQDLRTFSRLDDGEWLPVDLREAVDATLNLMSGRLDGVEIVREYADVPAVECLAGQLNQVFLNLLANAADAVGGDGRIVVRVFESEPGRVSVEVEDDGCGMEPDVAEHVFDPFFTTKDVGSGTGLGLSVSYGIVQRCGGHISVVSRPGSGSCFRVDLDRHRPASDETLNRTGGSAEG